MGRKALDAVMNRLPSFGGSESAVRDTAINTFEDPIRVADVYSGAADLWGDRETYADKAKSYAVGAGREVAGARAAKESAMNYYGLEKDENEKLRVARKIKFGKAVVKTIVNPIGTGSSVGTRAAYSARKAVKQEALGQFRAARDMVHEGFSPAITQQPYAATGVESSW